jgi:hypothetical protein
MPRWWVNRSSALERVHRDERALDKLFRLAKELPERTRFSAAFTEGQPIKEILRHARMLQADLIAIGVKTGTGTVGPLVYRVAIAALCTVQLIPEALFPTPRNRRLNGSHAA